MKPIRIIYSLTIATAVMCAAAVTVKAQNQVYSQNFDVDSGANWVTNIIGPTTPGDDAYNYANFYFDYSTVGIPPAPHGPATTIGLKMGCSLGPVASGHVSSSPYFPDGISVSPLGFGITDNFEMRYDQWMNYNKSGTGTTVVGGAGYGTAGTSAQVAGAPFDSVTIGTTLDGGSTADYRVYGSAYSTSYQDADHVITGDPLSPLVYFAGSRNQTAAYYATNFLAQPCPVAQTNLFPRQTGLTGPAGALAFAWHEVTLSKIGKTITYKVDGKLIATANTVDAGVNGGTNILFNIFDTNGNQNNDPDGTNVCFMLIDNVRITNLAAVVEIDATTANATPAGPVDGVFTITRNSFGAPLTINYTMSGTAVQGVDYSLLPASAASGTVTFDATQVSTNIIVHPLGGTPPSSAKSAIMTVNSGPGYASDNFALVTIADTNTPTIDISLVRGLVYERNTNDYALFKLTRRGDATGAPISVNIQATGGTGVAGTDFFFPIDPVVIDTGGVSTNFMVHPKDNAVVNNPNLTIGVAIATGSGYDIGTNTPILATIVDDDTPAENVIWSDSLHADTSANWTVFAGATNAPDYTVTWAYDYSGDSIPPAPHSGADTHGVKVSVNKSLAVATGVNLYPNGQSFSGNYALRFDMYLIEGSANNTEYALFGINHSGTKTNWFCNNTGGVGGPWTFDGIFYGVESDAQALGDYAAYSAPTTAGFNPTPQGAGRNASTLTTTFKSPPWSAAGAPANFYGSVTPSWADVEVSQIGNVVSLTIDRTLIFSITNTTGFTSGNVMLGYNDAYASISEFTAGAIFANARVISVAAPVLNKIQVTGGNALIDFTDNTANIPDQFVLQAAPVVIGPYVDVTSTNSALSSGKFRATLPVPVSDSAQFYRVRRAY